MFLRKVLNASGLLSAVFYILLAVRDIDYYKTKNYLGIISSWHSNNLVNNITYIIELSPSLFTDSCFSPIIYVNTISNPLSIDYVLVVFRLMYPQTIIYLRIDA